MQNKNYFDIYGIEPNRKIPSTGDVLVSNPLLEESWFNRSVIYIIDKDKDGRKVGLVLNKLMPFTLNQILDNLKVSRDIPVYCGGPVDSTRLTFLHNLGKLIPNSVCVDKEISIGGDISSVLSYISSGNSLEGHIKFFFGYSGWGIDQLEMEIETSSWGVCKITPDNIMGMEGEELWRKSVEKLGLGYSSWLKIPYSPSFN